MRHRKEGKKFNRKTGERRSFLRILVSNLIRYGKIETTETRAKAIRPLVERMITIARKQDLASRRLLLARLGNNKATMLRLVDEISPKYKNRPGGYTRITKLGTVRKRDGVAKARIELID
jgi:large subunit ribosomal protein L17